MNREALTAPALEALLQAPSLAILAVDKQGCVILWGPSASRMFGWTESEVLGRFIPIVPEEHRQEVYDRIQRELKGEIISPLDVRRLRKDGSLVDVSLWTTPLRDGTGEVTGILALYADITARKQSEQALRESEAELRRVLAAASDYFWSGEIDPQGGFHYRYFSPAVERITGRPAEFYIGGSEPYLSTIHPEDRARIAEISERQLAGQPVPSEDEHRIVWPDGTIRWVRARVTVSQSAAGHRRLDGVVSDITARKQSEESLRESEERYRTLAESAPDAIFIIDRDDRVQFVNTHAASMMGSTPKELTGKRRAELFPPNTSEHQRREIKAVFESGRPRHIQNRTPFAGGELWLDTQLVPLRGAGGEVGAVMGISRDITDQKRAEARLEDRVRESQRHLAAIVEFSDDAIVSAKLDGTLTSWNAGARRLYNYAAEEMLGRTISVLVPRNRRGEAREFRKKVLRGEHVQHFETVRLRKGGLPVDVAVTVSPIKNDAGQVIGVSAITRDITERRLAEVKLATLAHAVESTTELICITDLQDRFFFANRAFQKAYGYTEAELLGRSPEILYSSQNPTPLGEILEQTRLGGWRGEVLDRRKDGTEFPVRLSTSLVKDQTGQVIGLIGVAQDITERKRAEEALRKSEAQYRALVETTDTGFVILDPQGRVLDANAEYVRLTGHRDLDEIRGRSVVEWTAGAEQERNARAVRACLKTGHIRNLEIGYVDSHGKVTPIEVNATREKTGGTLRIVGLCRDITERKELEQAVVETSSREQRRIGLDMHDSLCQQLTGVGFLWQGIAQGVAAGVLPEAAEMTEINQLITKTISEARDLARVLCPVELEHSDLGVALKDLALSMERLFGISCVVRCQQTVPLADKAVATHLYRITQEAISNAIHHGKAARVRIHLVWKKNKLTLRIRDNGSGFSKTRGFREGIGMRSMKYRAQVIGGSLTVESKRGAGTTVACVYSPPRSRVAGEARRHPPGQNSGFHDGGL